MVKNPPANAENEGSIPGSGRSKVFLPGESHGLRGLVGCSPWGCNGLVMTY